jgi:hypothetical protein
MKQYIVSEQLLQAVLNVLSKARVDIPVGDLVNLVDVIRSLQPINPTQAEEAADETTSKETA